MANRRGGRSVFSLLLLTSFTLCGAACQAPAAPSPQARAAPVASTGSSDGGPSTSPPSLPDLAALALGAAPGLVLVAEERRNGPASWQWDVPRDGCFRAFVRSTAAGEFALGESTAPLVAHAVVALPNDGPQCALEGSKLSFTLRGATGTVQIVVVGSAPSH